MAQETFVPDFDWLIATNGKDRFKIGLITLNQEDLARFVPTGSLVAAFHIGNFRVENRQGTYYRNSDLDSSELDVPSSLTISHKGQMLLGGKGYSFSVDLYENFILIEHWDGGIGCSLSRWYLEYDLSPMLKVSESEYADATTGDRCSRE